MLKEPPGRIRYLMPWELERLIQYAISYLKIIILFAVGTGVRKGELRALKWKDIDFENGIAHIERSDKVTYSTKSADRRDVPLSKKVIQSIQTLSRDDEYIFPKGDFRKAFDNACRRAGIEDFLFHDLRHTFCSHLVMEGTDIAIVSKLMGHKSLAMTMRYSHLAPDITKQAVERLAEKLLTFC